MKVDWILFDFGGCLDSDGLHSRTLFFNAFKEVNLLQEIDRPRFQEAYSVADSLVVNNSLVINKNLNEMNEVMTSLIANELSLDLLLVPKISAIITDVQSYYLRRNYPVLEKLSLKYKLGIISNFSGNLYLILEEFKLSQFFKFAIDSYYEKVQKPDLEIFRRAIKKCNVAPDRIIFIGDNPDRDIAPANMLKMKTILVTSHENPKKSSISDFTVTDLTKIIEYF